jgi:hypothetical protein
MTCRSLAPEWVEGPSALMDAGHCADAMRLALKRRRGLVAGGNATGRSGP